MRIEKIHIENFRILQNITIFPNDILSLVGDNNSGKSTVLKALEIFFENSIRLVSNEIFHNNDTTKTIIIEVTFSDFSTWEKDELNYWIQNDKLIVKREISYDEFDNPIIKTIARIKEPRPEWLKMESVNGENIKGWLENKPILIIEGINFLDYLEGAKPQVGTWKDAIEKFIDENNTIIEYEEVEKENPRGYPNVLKGTLPEFILIPAVKDINEEIKVTSSSSFGRIINKLFEKIPENEIKKLETEMTTVKNKLNRSSTDSLRFSQIKELEKTLNKLMQEIMDCDIELEFDIPAVKDVISKVSIFVGDGVRTPIYMKGHGLQRSAIFTILRAYAELKNQEEDMQEKQRTTIFAFEEPELYLHPQLQRILYKTFREISGNEDQVFYTTHSSLFIDITYFDDICILKKETSADNCYAVATQLFMKTLIGDLFTRKGVHGTEAGIRELYSNIFNSEISEGFFADKVVIVEGPSEKYILPIYSEAIGLNLDKKNIAIVHAEGKNSIDRLLRIFGGFNIKVYTWFDGDKENTDSSIKAKSLELLELLGSSIDDSQNITTVVNETYAVLENKLEDILIAEISNYTDLVQKAHELLGPGIGKPLLHKYMANTLTKGGTSESFTDAFIPPTIKSICEKIDQLDTVTNILRG